MITINLLPSQLRKAERKPLLPANIPYKAYLFGVIALLIVLHLSLLSLAALKKIQLISLNVSWKRMEPQTKDSIDTKKEIKGLETDVAALKGVLTRQASLTELLSGVNAAVPKGLWMESFSFGDEGLVIQGTVVSLQQSEMTIIGNFLQDIKNNKTFSSLFSKIELSSVQRRTIKMYDVVDFVIIGELKK